MQTELAPDYLIIVLCQRSTQGLYDIAFRMFAPAVGIKEDHVCGSANSFAAGYWASKTGIGSGSPMRVKAVSARGGDIELVWEESQGLTKLRGEARVATRGEIYI